VALDANSRKNPHLTQYNDKVISPMNMDETVLPEPKKPLAGTCHHKWQKQAGPYVVAQVCELCRLYRYKSSATADWEYRAAIPYGRAPEE
jgi:hypothetical protein